MPNLKNLNGKEWSHQRESILKIKSNNHLHRFRKAYRKQKSNRAGWVELLATTDCTWFKNNNQRRSQVNKTSRQKLLKILKLMKRSICHITSQKCVTYKNKDYWRHSTMTYRSWSSKTILLRMNSKLWHVNTMQLWRNLCQQKSQMNKC